MSDILKVIVPGSVLDAAVSLGIHPDRVKAHAKLIQMVHHCRSVLKDKGYPSDIGNHYYANWLLSLQRTDKGIVVRKIYLVSCDTCLDSRKILVNDKVVPCPDCGDQ